MRNMLRCMLIPFLCLLGLFCSLQAQDAPILKIAALHPVLGDMARSIGGSRVQVADLLRPNGNLHSLNPRRRILPPRDRRAWCWPPAKTWSRTFPN